MRLTVGLRPRVTVAIADELVVLHHPWGNVSVAGPPWLGGVMEVLAAGDLDADGIIDALVDRDVAEEDAVITAIGELDEFLSRVPMVVQRSLYVGESAGIRLVPIASHAPHLAALSIPDEFLVTLSRHAYLHRRTDEPGLSLESPLALHRAQLGPWMIALVGQLADAPLMFDELLDDTDRAAVGFLVSAGLLDADLDGSSGEKASMWSFHDLLFHAKSRQGRSDDLFGAHLLHSEQVTPLSPVAVRTPPESITTLPVPSFDAVLASDVKLTTAIESRRSIREYAEAPITLSELGELLYRCARLRGVVPLEGVGGMLGANRPYPTGGMAGDLEIFVTAANCDGLAPGAYSYNARAHQLELVNSLDAAEPLLIAARISSGFELAPQVLLTITSRFSRLSWKYESIAYALTLKHVGVLMQTIYLVATSMGLAPCSLGSGDADASARVFGLDWLDESSVGEMLIGRPSEPMSWATYFADSTNPT